MNIGKNKKWEISKKTLDWYMNGLRGELLTPALNKELR